MRTTLAIILSVLFTFCSSISEQERDLRNTINKTISLKGLTQVHFKNETISLNEFKQKFSYIFLEYLEDGCNPCYQKFFKWTEKVKFRPKEKNFEVLFVIHTKRYSDFRKELYNFLSNEMKQNTVEEFYYVIDENLNYLIENRLIPRWIIDRSVLIDSQSRIRMVGAPWATPEMTELFQRICSEDKND